MIEEWLHNGRLRRGYPIGGALPAGDLFTPEVAARTFSFEHKPSGLSARIEWLRKPRRCKPSSFWNEMDRYSYMTVDGHIETQDGDRIGSFAREVRLYDDGRLIVQHCSLELAAAFHQQGFGRAYFDHLERCYRRKHVAAIFVTAGEDVGGYCWAGSGFVFQPEDTYLSCTRQGRADAALSWWKGARRQARSLVRRGRLADAELARLEQWFSLAARFDELEPPTPAQIAAIGKDRSWVKRGRRGPTWAGKELLIDSVWAGVKVLDQRRYTQPALTFARNNSRQQRQATLSSL